MKRPPRLLASGLAAAAGLVLVTSANAISLDTGAFGIGDSWTFSWTDSTAIPFTRLEFFITTGGASFDLPAEVGGVQGTLVNGTYTHVDRSPAAVNSWTPVKLFFNDPKPGPGEPTISLDMLYWNGDDLIETETWRWTGIFDGNTGISNNMLPTTTGSELMYDRTAAVPDLGVSSLMLAFGMLALGGVRRLVT